MSITIGRFAGNFRGLRAQTICLLSGSTGKSTPAVSEISRAHAPAVKTTFSVSILPLFARTALTLPFSVSIAKTVVENSIFAPYSAAFFAKPSNTPSGSIKPSVEQKLPPTISAQFIPGTISAIVLVSIILTVSSPSSFCASDGFIDPLAVLEGFAKKATKNGAKIEFETAVSAIETENGKVRAVKTNRDRIETENVILTAGAWARAIAETAGIDLPVEPLRRQIVWARAPRELPANLPMVIDIGTGFHFRPAKNSRTEVLFAYPDRDEKPTFKTEFDNGFIAKVYEKAEQRASFLAETSVIREKCRAGLYENTPDHHAIIGGCEIEGLYFCNGFSGHGVMHSPASGRAVAEILLDGAASFMDVSMLDLKRFAEKRLIHETSFI